MEKAINQSSEKKQLNDVIKTIKSYISKKKGICTDLPILMDRDVQDGVFIEDSKIFKTPTKSIRYDLTLPLFIYYGDKNLKSKKLSYTLGPVFRVEKEDSSHLSEFNQFEIDIINPTSIRDDVSIGKYMKDIAKMFFNEESLCLRINYRPLTEWLMSLSNITNRQEFYNVLDSLDKEFSEETCKKIFQENYELAIKVLQCSSVEEFEKIDDFPKEILAYFRQYKELDDQCVIRPLLARGALYYDGVVYEMFHSKLSSAIMGGGRGSMYGVTRVGASFGLERLLLCIKQQ